ncbi:hypothetical protein AB0M43_01090 [Longispora sp. NPDC051575]|uniref:hypothetical protein n=1 Tax=Longispora sp. NPDC051575 TaxID=3154943 RepID=UPI003423083D
MTRDSEDRDVQEPARPRSWLVGAGVTAVVVFFVLRAIARLDANGAIGWWPRHWSVQLLVAAAALGAFGLGYALIGRGYRRPRRDTSDGRP